MRKFFTVIFFFSFLTCSSVFGQNYHSAEVELSFQNDIVGSNTLGYAELGFYEQGKYTNSLFMFTSINENFSQLYGGLTMSVGELSAGAGAGITNDTNLRTALFANWTGSYYIFSAVGEMDWSEGDSKENFFYNIKLLAYESENIFSAGLTFRRFNGLGPILEFKFGSHVAVWCAPGMWDFLESKQVSSMFGFRLN